MRYTELFFGSLKYQRIGNQQLSPDEKRTIGQLFYKWLKVIGTSIGVLSLPVTFFDLIGYPATVVGSSMAPTLQGNDQRWWKRDIVWLTRFGILKPEVGKVYTFIPPNDPEKRHIKRVTAVEGDIIRPNIGPSIVELPTGSCWMESDNPSNMYDSRIYGPVYCALLTARATHVIWPPSRWGKISKQLFDHNTKPLTGRWSMLQLRYPW